MKAKTRSRRSVPGAGALAALAAVTLWAGPLAPPASAYVHVTTDTGEPVRWLARCVDVWSHESVLDDFDPAVIFEVIEAATAPWTAVTCSYVSLRLMGFTCFAEVGLSRWPGAQNVISWPQERGEWVHPQRVVALTSLTYDLRTGELVDADIEVNGVDYTFALDGDPHRYDLQQTLTHEVGHLLGLDHSEYAEATMHESSRPGETHKRTLHEDDIAGLCASHPLSRTPGGGACAAPELAEHEAPWCPPTPKDNGCAAAPGPTGAWALLLALMLLGARAHRAASSVAPRLGTAARRRHGGVGRGRPPAPSPCSRRVSVPPRCSRP